MMGLRIYLLLSLFIVVIAKRAQETKRNSDEPEPEELEENKKQDYVSRTPPGTLRQSAIGENVIEKFVETLMSSERYLKMIDSVERKMTHLDTVFHEKTNGILKYLTDMQKTVKSASTESVLQSIKALQTDLNEVKVLLRERADTRPALRDGGDYHNDASLDARFSFLENHVKSIQTGVDSIVSTIAEVKSRQFGRTYTGTSSRSEVATPLDAVALIAEFRKTIRDHKSTKKCECKSNRVDRSERYPTDCHEIQMQGFNVSGIYKIRPDDMDPFYVLCDLTTAGGGWTVFQNRFDGSQDFLKGWSDYEYGFGNLAGEFWLGLEKLNYLTNQKLYELRIEMETQRGQEAYAGYSVFTVGPEQEGYRISTLGTFYGTAGDSLSYHAGQKFSTIDMDNDEWKDGACATEHGGAWWYKECDKSNLNGKYTQPGEENRGQSMYWISFKGPNSPLSKTKMMIRPLPASKPVDYTEANRKLLEVSNVTDLTNNVEVAQEELVAPLSKMDVSGQFDFKHDAYEGYMPYDSVPYYGQSEKSKTIFSGYM